MNRLVATILLSAFVVCGQTNRGSISGTVTDSTKSAVAGAVITITNLGTNQVRKLTTAENGSYSAADLEPVTYSVQVKAPGFKEAVVENVKVDTASVAPVNVVLEPGSIDTKITVSAEAAMVNTESGTTSQTITEREIQDVPLLNRSVLDLALTLPNVSGDAGSEDPGITAGTACPGCNLTLGGGRPMSSMIMADGTNNTGVSLARSIVSFTPETVQEFTVQTSAFSAEYGTTGGGIINATTKSGTNELHGTALWYNRNPDFAAAPFTLASTRRPVPTLKFNQFSLAVGGPVWIPKIYNGRNKTFWFAAIEPQYRRDHLDQYGLMPTPEMRNGDFSGLVNTPSGWLPQNVVSQFQGIAPNAVTQSDSTIYDTYNVAGNQFTTAALPTGQTAFAPFPGNVIPKNMLDSTAQKALTYIAPAGPYYLNGNGLISNIYAPRLLTQDEKRYTVRVDQTISDKNHLYGRFTATPIVKIQGTPVSPTNNGAVYSWGSQAMVADTHTFSPTVFNDVRLNYTRGRFSNTVDPQWDPKTGANLNTAFGLPSITKGGLPSFNALFPGSSLGGGGSTATGFGGAGSTEEDDREERYGFTDIVYKTHGSMSFKFGVDVSHSLQNIIPLYGAFGGVYNFSNIQTDSTGTSTGTGGSPFASFLLGTVNGSVTARNVEVPYYYRWNAGAAFIQDDWKVKSNLTLNFGLRYSLEMPRTEKYNNQGVFRPDLAQTQNLPAPLVLQDGEVITSSKVVPFAFSGIGGNSRHLTAPQYRDFEPRFGFAWSPTFLQSRRLTFRGGWGMSHAPISGFTQLPQPDFGATAGLATTSPSQTANPTDVMRLGENPPTITPVSPATQVFGPQGPPANGLSFVNGLYYQQAFGGYAVSQNYHTPYVNNWNFTTSWQANSSTTVEVAYTGSMGIHLFMGQEDINPKDNALLTAQLAQNVNTIATTPDPLGRLNPITGKVLAVQQGTLGSPYLGFSSLYNWYDAAGNSIRHAGYINVNHRVSRGLTFLANYTYSKEIDDASSAGGDKNILTAVGGQAPGQVIFGGTRAADRSVSTFDQRHVIHGSAIYDLPIGRGRALLGNAWKPLDYVVGGWTATGLTRWNSGFPYIVYLSDTNQLGDSTHSARPDMLSGVPLVNPLYSKNCPVGTGCQPYLNPAAFMRPPLGQLGNAPRTLDGARGPWAQSIDLSLQKNFSISERFRLQFRVDALNALNHPIFTVYPNNAGGADFMGAPSTANLTTTAYNTWAAANGQPLQNTAAGAAIYSGIVSMINGQKSSTGALPANFYTTPLPANFYGMLANSYNITTLQGYKNYQLRNAYGANFGTLYNSNTPRYVQFGVKLYF
ncbi:MAG: carboxypeptidase-like regulatory domain-containing protein [Candidatus Sulfopaludibacter sp.]|nr:carboxypeptidase-like regulatory domain-containing protein [Candidatus Sulfopaludibacter sp.]